MNRATARAWQPWAPPLADRSPFGPGLASRLANESLATESDGAGDQANGMAWSGVAAGNDGPDGRNHGHDYGHQADVRTILPVCAGWLGNERDDSQEQIQAHRSGQQMPGRRNGKS